MNEIVNKFLLAGETFMLKLYLRLNLSSCGLFSKHFARIKKFK